MRATTTDGPQQPVFYWAALGITLTPKTTYADVKAAYAELAKNGMHPDHGGDAATWQLITAAYNELKSWYGKKRGRYTTTSDLGWLRSFNDLKRPATRPSEPKAAGSDKPKAEQSQSEHYVFIKREGESKEDARRRYAREAQAFRYARDPEFAAKRRASSLKSHAAKRAREAAEKNAKATA